MHDHVILQDIHCYAFTEFVIFLEWELRVEENVVCTWSFSFRDSWSLAMVISLPFKFNLNTDIYRPKTKWTLLSHYALHYSILMHKRTGNYNYASH